MAQAGVRKRPNRRALGYLVPVGAVVLALIIAAVMLSALGASPLEGFRAMLDGAFNIPPSEVDGGQALVGITQVRSLFDDIDMLQLSTSGPQISSHGRG